jgi:hypothetical protein
MSTRGALAKSELDIAVEKFEKHPIEVRAKYDKIIELFEGLDVGEQNEFSSYLSLVDSINEMVRSRIRHANSKPLTFMAPTQNERVVIMDVDSDDEPTQKPTAKRRWTL